MKLQVEIKLTRDMLGTNPIDPNILDKHILEKQRKIISEKCGVNATINKYLDQIQISKERGDNQIDALLAKLEDLMGREFTKEERSLAVSGELESLKETFAEQDLKGVTVFFRDKKTGLPCIGDHMIYGFMKAATEAICRTQEKANGKILQSASYTQSIINQHVRIQKQFIPFSGDIAKDEHGNPTYLQRSLRAMTAQGPRVSLAKSEYVEAGSVLKFELEVMDGSPLEEKHIKQMFDYGKFKGLGQWRNAGYGSFEYTIKH